MAAGAVRELPPTAAVVEHGSCDLRLSSSYFAFASAGAADGGGRPTVSCNLQIYVHRRLSLEIIHLGARDWEASRLLSPQGAAEDQAAVHARVVQVMVCMGLPHGDLEWVGRTLLGYARDVAAWAVRPGAAPLMSKVLAAIHVRVNGEDDDLAEDVDDDYEEEEESSSEEGEVLPSSSSESEAEEDCGEGLPSAEECCAICLKRMPGRWGRRWLPCSHSFHGRCIGIWLRRKQQCPLCRSQMTGPAP